jgi:hypothetical protein
MQPLDNPMNAVMAVRKLSAVLLLLSAGAWFLPGISVADAHDIQGVLVLYSNNRPVPGNVAVDHGLASALTRDVDQPVPASLPEGAALPRAA